MTKKAEITLKNIRKSPKLAKEFRLSDFVSKEEVREVRQNNRRGKKKKRQFDDVDAYTAEIIARFGYDVYQKWNYGEIDSLKMQKWILAERARERSHWIPLESIVLYMVGACIKRHKREKAPKGLKMAQKIMKEDFKAMRGES